VPPVAVPRQLREGIAAAESASGESAAGSHWTLTWLEGRPIAVLDDGTTVTLEDGAVRIGHEDAAASDDW
jgi:hypothetical protein